MGPPPNSERSSSRDRSRRHNYHEHSHPHSHPPPSSSRRHRRSPSPYYNHHHHHNPPSSLSRHHDAPRGYEIVTVSGGANASRRRSPSYDRWSSSRDQHRYDPPRRAAPPDHRSSRRETQPSSRDNRHHEGRYKRTRDFDDDRSSKRERLSSPPRSNARPRFEPPPRRNGDYADERPPASMGHRGRGVHVNRPAWMTRGDGDRDRLGAAPSNDPGASSRSSLPVGDYSNSSRSTSANNRHPSRGVNSSSSIEPSRGRGRGRGVGLTLPAWMTRESARAGDPPSAVTSTPSATSSAAIDRAKLSSTSAPVAPIPQSTVSPSSSTNSGGRGRGRNLTLPAWMTSGTNGPSKTPINPPPSDVSLPPNNNNDASFSNGHVAPASPPYRDAKRRTRQRDRQRDSRPRRDGGREQALPKPVVPSSGPSSVGRGRDRTLPAWMTKAPS